MRTEAELKAFNQEAHEEFIVRGQAGDTNDPDLEAADFARYQHAVRMHEANVPRVFWKYTPDDVEHNREVFDEVVAPYIRKVKTAFRHGYGLLFTGDNGVGKTMFTTLVLRRVLRLGLSAYYTTMLGLDHNIKRGFDDKAVRERLDWYLTSDFLAIDELAKEQFKAGDSFARTQVERILKTRFEEEKPTLLATNASMEELEGVYGATLTSILDGKYTVVAMEPGDFRAKMKAKMRKDMS